MTMAISASYPLGVYTGHSPSGLPERIPTFGRAYSALVQAAAKGSTATGNPADPYAPASLAALTWLEENPPDGLVLPRVEPIAPGRRLIAYRAEGVFLKEGKATNYKVIGKDMSDGTAVGGPIKWMWRDEPAPEIVETIDILCADIPYLGEASSPVLMHCESSTTTPPTHLRDTSSGLRPPAGAIRESVPAPGRLAELDEAHTRVAGTAKLPSVASDKHGTSARPHAISPPRTRLQSAIYKPVDPPVHDVPWSMVLALPIISGSESIPDEHMVSVCVAMHRAIVSKLGPDASPLITGTYLPGVEQPANRLAIHLLPGDVEAAPFTDGRDRMLVMIPLESTADDLGQAAGALASIERVVTRDHQLRLAPEEMEIFDGQAFWRPVPEATYRTWEASPAMVAERHISGVVDGVSDLDVAAAWSLGNVFREIHPELYAPRPQERWAAAEELGLGFRCRGLRSFSPRSFVHRSGSRSGPPGKGRGRALPPHPFRAELDLGTLVPDRAIVALGQSRHLGCGLLLPVDRPIPTRPEES
ncbi:MAG: type I-U CRISPR-associated protein Csb2 [Dermabacter sp.]|nr:type I-U CRISPR-associated protein Csb2 [Dermabacter sp.]